MDAVMERPQHVATETHVERQLIKREGNHVAYAYRLVWEGCVIASTRVEVAEHVTLEEIDNTGITWLLRACTRVA